MSFEIQRIDRQDFQILSVRGYMGKDEYRKLESKLEELFELEHRHIILDFTGLTFVTSASLSRLAKQARWFQREGGEIRLCGLPTSAIRLLQLGQLARAFNVAADLAAAVQSIPTASRLKPRHTKSVALKRPLRRGFRKTKTEAVEPS